MSSSFQKIGPALVGQLAVYAAPETANQLLGGLLGDKTVATEILLRQPTTASRDALIARIANMSKYDVTDVLDYEGPVHPDVIAAVVKKFGRIRHLMLKVAGRADLDLAMQRKLAKRKTLRATLRRNIRIDPSILMKIGLEGINKFNLPAGTKPADYYDRALTAMIVLPTLLKLHNATDVRGVSKNTASRFDAQYATDTETAIGRLLPTTNLTKHTEHLLNVLRPERALSQWSARKPTGKPAALLAQTIANSDNPDYQARILAPLRKDRPNRGSRLEATWADPGTANAAWDAGTNYDALRDAAAGSEGLSSDRLDEAIRLGFHHAAASNPTLTTQQATELWKLLDDDQHYRLYHAPLERDTRHHIINGVCASTIATRVSQDILTRRPITSYEAWWNPDTACTLIEASNNDFRARQTLVENAIASWPDQADEFIGLLRTTDNITDRTARRLGQALADITPDQATIIGGLWDSWDGTINELFETAGHVVR